MPRRGQTPFLAGVPQEGVLSPPAGLPKPLIRWEEPQKPLVWKRERSGPCLPPAPPVPGQGGSEHPPTRASALQQLLSREERPVLLRGSGGSAGHHNVGGASEEPPALGAGVTAAPCRH